MGFVITFYSYKGGVGRTMALANVAIMLARWGYKTLIIDWDLEAPGIEYYFKDYLDLSQIGNKMGLIDLLYAKYENTDQSINEVGWRGSVIETNLPSGYYPVHLITAGEKNDLYFSKVQNLDFQNFYLKKDGGYFIEQLRDEWKKEYDFVLLDSRTGVTDIGGITTVHLPDYLLLFLTTTEQSIKGTIDIAKKASAARRGVPFDRFPLISIPVLSRFDSTEEFKISQLWLKRFSTELTDLYANWLPSEIDRRNFLELTKIPYISYFSFGEKLPVIEQGTSDPQGIGYAYATLAGLIAHKFDSIELFIENRTEYLKNIQKTKDLDSSVSISSELVTIEDRLSAAGYEIIELVSQKDDSRVYKARDIGLNRITAIKVILLGEEQDSRSQENSRLNFINEAQIVASLNHPNIGKIYQVLSDPFAIIMEWIEGKSLKDELDSNQTFSLIEITKIGIALSNALIYSHQNNIVHRDIKPGNILLTENREPILIDFELAKPIHLSSLSQNSPFFVGTPTYSSPEQLTSPYIVGFESDLFSLGVVLYELITHIRPFEYGNLPNMYPDGHLPAPHQGDIPNQLYKIICRLLSEDPNKRPTATTLNSDLLGCLGNIENSTKVDEFTNNKITVDNRVVFGRGLADDVLPNYSQSENSVLKYLTDNLVVSKVGDYRIWVDYVMSPQKAGAFGTMEIDLVVINRFGVFLFEVKELGEKIDAYEDAWIISDKIRHINPLNVLSSKAKILNSLIVQKLRGFNNRKRLLVSGLIVLTRGTSKFNNHIKAEGRVYGLDSNLFDALSLKWSGYDLLSDQDIRSIFDILYKEYGSREASLVGNYRILGRLSSNELFDAYEAENINIVSQRVRVKRYQLPKNSGKEGIQRLQRNATIISTMGTHPNILTTFDFIPDQENYDVFYEVTELPQGYRLDELIAQSKETMPLRKQVQIIEQLCKALSHAHNNLVVHRAISPAVIYVLNSGIVKLADFDFAKSSDIETIIKPHKGLEKNSDLVAPEVALNLSYAAPVSDIYSLGMIWFYLASLPSKHPSISNDAVDELDLPDNVKDLIKKMTAKAPGNRPQNIIEILEEISKLQE